MWVRHNNEMVNLDRIEQITLSDKLHAVYFIGRQEDSECPMFVYGSAIEASDAFDFICKALEEEVLEI